MAATEFMFLTVDGHGRPLEPGSRVSIRSRCMKGVNVRQGSRRSRRKARKASETVTATKSPGKSTEFLEITSSYQLTSCGPLVKSLQVRTDELGFDSSRLPSTVLRLGMYCRSASQSRSSVLTGDCSRQVQCLARCGISS